jgi:hypothetical protein
MRSLRAAATIFFASAAFILPAIGTASTSQIAAGPVTSAASLDGTPWD